MEQSIFFQLSIVLALATAVALLFRMLRQPLIASYLVAGFLAGPSVWGIIHNHEAFESFSQIGIALLLFIIGLGLNVGVIRSAGKPVIVTFLAITAGIGLTTFGVSAFLGMTFTESLLMAVALLFSSTIIVVKSLSDKKEQSRLYGQIAIGILLVEDIVATVALLFVAAGSGGAGAPLDVALLLGKGVLLAGVLAGVSMYILPKGAKLFASSQELLYIFALAWAFGVASLCWRMGFSLEVGALFAGVALAHLPYAQEISTRLKPLRDFFIVLFFIRLGERLGVGNLTEALVPAVILSAVIIVLKPLFIMMSLGALGYTKQTGFKTAVHLSQISEFSIVLIVLGYNQGLTDEYLPAVIALTAMITIATSSYLMQYDAKLYKWLQKPLSVFERGDVKNEKNTLHHYPLVLLGYHEGGHEFIHTFRKMNKPYVVVEYDPHVIDILERQHIHAIYGDATDFELLDEIGMDKAEIIISVIADADTNRQIVNHIKHRNKRAIFICHAAGYDEAEMLYAHGASYVLLPHFVGNAQINDFIRRNGGDKEAYKAYRKKHLETLGNILLRH